MGHNSFGSIRRPVCFQTLIQVNCLPYNLDYPLHVLAKQGVIRLFMQADFSQVEAANSGCLWFQYSESRVYNKLWQMMLEFKASGKSVLTTDYDIQVAMAKTGGNYSLNKFCADISMTSRRFPSSLVLKCWVELQHFWTASYLPCIIGTFWMSKTSLNGPQGLSQNLLWACQTMWELYNKTSRGYRLAKPQMY